MEKQQKNNFTDYSCWVFCIIWVKLNQIIKNYYLVYYKINHFEFLILRLKQYIFPDSYIKGIPNMLLL